MRDETVDALIRLEDLACEHVKQEWPHRWRDRSTRIEIIAWVKAIRQIRKELRHDD